MRKVFMLTLLFILAIGVLAACGGKEESLSETETDVTNQSNNQGDSDEPKEGGSVTIAFPSEPGNLNPMIWATTSDTNITHMIFDSLVIPNNELKMVGSLAKDWEVSEDGKTYTFHLQENVKWHDGTPFTAKDVAFTFNAIARPEYDAGAYWRVEPVVGAEEVHAGKAQEVSGIKVIDDLTISFTTKERYAPFISGLFIGILPEHILKDVSPADWAKNDFNRNPIGTGPFKFVKWETGQYIELEANKDYFKGAPHLDKIVARFGDANTMLAAVLNKEVDITSVPIAEVDSVLSVDFASIKLQDNLSTYYIGFNARNEHFKDARVRKALAHAIDKVTMVETILGSYGYPINDIYPSKHWSHNPNLPTYQYDLEKADQLMQEAGYSKNSKGIYEKNGKELSFTLEVPTGKKEREQSATMIKQNLEEFGVKVELRNQDFPTLVTKLLPKTPDGKQREVTADDFDAYILGFGIEADPDEYRSYFGSAYMPPNGYNFCGYSNPEVDKLLEQQAHEVDFEKRKEITWELGRIFAEDEIWIPLYEQSDPYIVNNRVAGFEPDFRGVTFNAKDWSVK